MWKFGLAALLLMGLLAYVLKDERAETSEGIAAELVTDQELHRGMKKILARNKHSIETVDDELSTKRTFPTPDEIRDSADSEPHDAADIEKFRKESIKDHQDNLAAQRKENLEILEREIPRDEALIKELRQKGDDVSAERVRVQLEQKYELLRTIQTESED